MFEVWFCDNGWTRLLYKGLDKKRAEFTCWQNTDNRTSIVQHEQKGETVIMRIIVK